MTRPIPIRTEADKERALADVNDIEPEMDRPYVVTIKREARVRSLSQNGLYWKWVGIAADELGYDWDKDDLHEALMQKCEAPKRRYTDFNGNIVERYSTAGSDKAEMAAYMDRCYRFLTEWGIRLPLPEEGHLR